MIGFSKDHKTVGALQEQVAALSHQLIILTSQLVEIAGAQLKAAQLENILAEVKDVVAVHSTTLEQQAKRIDAQDKSIVSLRNARQRQDEEVKKIQGHLAGLEHQALIDLDEIRRTNSAIAASMLLRSSNDAVSGDSP